MVRERQCGEFFVLNKDEEKYIYSADKDNWVKISHSDLKDKAINKDAGVIDNPNPTNNNGVMNEAAKGTLDDNPLIFRPHQTYRMASAILAQRWF